jgi:hypothetical protein
MFTEFGHGRVSVSVAILNVLHGLPFWLFTILWAMISFFLIQTLASVGFVPGAEWTPIQSSSTVATASQSVPRSKPKSSNDLKPGYYMLNTEGTAAEGVPKYIYIGAAPES